MNEGGPFYVLSFSAIPESSASSTGLYTHPPPPLFISSLSAFHVVYASQTCKGLLLVVMQNGEEKEEKKNTNPSEEKKKKNETTTKPKQLRHFPHLDLDHSGFVFI